jgi:hypothetical protein
MARPLRCGKWFHEFATTLLRCKKKQLAPIFKLKSTNLERARFQHVCSSSMCASVRTYARFAYL